YQHAPFPADHMMHQQDRQASERHSGPVEIAEKIRTEKLLPVEQQRQYGQHHSRDADKQRISLPLADSSADGVGWGHGVFSKAGRWSGGTSSILAFSLNCKTRM